MSILRMLACRLLAFAMVVACSSPNGNVAADESEDPYSVYPENPVKEDERDADSGSSIPLPVINRPGYHTIEIKQMKFIPEELRVKKGDTIVWVNNGITAHDVTQQPSALWTSSSFAVGESWSMVATESADYYCSIHVVMTGKVIVE